MRENGFRAVGGLAQRLVVRRRQVAALDRPPARGVVGRRRARPCPDHPARGADREPETAAPASLRLRVPARPRWKSSTWPAWSERVNAYFGQ